MTKVPFDIYEFSGEYKIPIVLGSSGCFWRWEFPEYNNYADDKSPCVLYLTDEGGLSEQARVIYLHDYCKQDIMDMIKKATRSDCKYILGKMRMMSVLGQEKGAVGFFWLINGKYDTT